MRPSTILPALAALTLIVLAPYAATLADDGHGPDVFRVIDVAADDALNIRATPSASAKKVGTIPHDATGIAYDFCIGEATYQEWSMMTEAEHAAAARLVWCRITYDGTTGWAAGRFLGE